MSVVIPLSRPLNMETQWEPAVVSSLQDPLQQARVQISTASLQGVQSQQLPWAKVNRSHSQVSTQQGGTMESPHSFKNGDVILVERPTASQQDWIAVGHPGSVNNGQQGGQGTSTGPQTSYWGADLKTGNTQAAKPKVTKTTYPQSGMATWTNPGQTQMQISDQPDVRQFFLKQMGSFNGNAQKDLWSNGYHITESQATGSPVTQVIQQEDQTYVSEAQKNSQAVQMVHRLRTELNDSSFDQFAQQANNGLLKTFSSLLQGGGSQTGMITNLLSAFQQMGQQTNQNNQNQNNQMANNIFLDINGTPISNNTLLNT